MQNWHFLGTMFGCLYHFLGVWHFLGTILGVYTTFWDLHAKLGLFWDQIWTLVPFGTKSQIWDFTRAPAKRGLPSLLDLVWRAGHRSLGVFESVVQGEHHLETNMPSWIFKKCSKFSVSKIGFKLICLMAGLVFLLLIFVRKTFGFLQCCWLVGTQ